MGVCPQQVGYTFYARIRAQEGQSQVSIKLKPYDCETDALLLIQTS